MEPDLILKISETIVRDQILLNWRFYGLVLALTFLANAASHWLASYFKKRGETFATKSDMQEILKQVAQTTRATEEVRSAISQADWAAREWQTTRRMKLEELLSSTYALEQWLDQNRAKWVFKEIVEIDPSPIHRLKLLATLYFPELKNEVNAIWLRHQKSVLLFIETGQNINAAVDTDAHKAALANFTKVWKQTCIESAAEVDLLEKKASALMTEVAGA